MQLPPPEILATWPKPNYVDPETRGNAVNVVNSILFSVSLFVIVIRVYTRVQISKSFGLDDWLIVAAMLPSTTFAILAILAEQVYKFNRHVWDLPTSQVAFGLQYIMITQIIFALGQAFTKCSMLALLYRILSNGKRFKMMTIAATVAVAVQGIIFILVVIFQCRPTSHYWRITFAPQPECINQTAHVTFAGSLNTLTDCLVVLFPIPKILKLQISRYQRFIVVILFGAGFLVCVAGAVRTYYTHIQLTSTDITWDTYYVWISSSVELYIGIIGASIPATKPFFKRYIPLLFDPTRISSRNNHYTVSSADKGPYSGSNTNTTSGASRISRTLSKHDVELGEIRERELRTKTHPMNLDAIEEVGGTDTSISSFVHSGKTDTSISSFVNLRGRKSVESRGDDTSIGLRYGDMNPRSEDAFYYRGTSKDELIDEIDIGMSVPCRYYPPLSSQ